MLQRGIRLNPESIELWVEHVKLELEFAEMIRRRQEILTIKEDDTETEGAAARKDILEGAIVKEVLVQALKGMKTSPPLPQTRL